MRQNAGVNKAVSEGVSNAKIDPEIAFIHSAVEKIECFCNLHQAQKVLVPTYCDAHSNAFIDCGKDWRVDMRVADSGPEYVMPVKS